MNRERLADEAPSWLAIETFAAHAKSATLVRWIESILDASNKTTESRTIGKRFT